MDEPKVSPATIAKGAALLIYEAVGLVKLRSYATATSPAAVKLEGKDVSKAVSETEKTDEEESRILNNLPVVEPFEPIFKAKRSPVAKVEDPGDQSSLKRVLMDIIKCGST